MKKRLSLITIWLSLSSTAPFIFYSWPGHPYKVLTAICLLIMSVVVLNKQHVIIDKGVLISALILMVFFIIEGLRANSYEGYTYLLQIAAFVISYLFIKNTVGFRSFSKSYLLLIILMGIGGTLTFFIHYIWGLNPIFSVDYSATGRSFFMGLTSTNSMYVGSGGFIRYSGFFDEPGSYALYASFGLIINKLSYDLKKVEIALSILPLFTLSLAFFVFIVLYHILFNLKGKFIFTFIFFTLILGLSFVYLKSNPESILYEQTIGRFEADNSKGFKGNNRALSQAKSKELFLSNILFGNGLNTQSSANLYAVLAKHGIIGSLFYYTFLIYFIFNLFKYKSSKMFCFKVLLLVSLSFYHRPELTSAFGLIVITTMIFALRKNNIDINNRLNEETINYRPTKLAQ